MIKTIYVAGGCFWGIQSYFNQVHGILQSEVGYANGVSEHASYQDLKTSFHAESVKLTYDANLISLPFIVDLLFEVIDPTSLNKQGGDIGTQYRTGVYYVEQEDQQVIEASLHRLQANFAQAIVVEVAALRNYVGAEEYHQNYLDKNVNGYCHIGKKQIGDVGQRVDPYLYPSKTKEQLKSELSDMSYAVTQENKTEPPFKNEYYDEFAKGIYVDVTTGEPLFTSKDKFESGCGWPAFAKPIYQSSVQEQVDQSFGMKRVEVRSHAGNAHLGHLFDDGPKQLGGLRYCINAAALRFIALEEMEEQGYGSYVSLVE